MYASWALININHIRFCYLQEVHPGLIIEYQLLDFENTDSRNRGLVAGHGILAVGSAEDDIDLSGGSSLAILGVVGAGDSGSVLRID